MNGAPDVYKGFMYGPPAGGESRSNFHAGSLPFPVAFSPSEYNCSSEMMMEQGTGTLIVGALGILGTLGGVVIGQYMARSREREQWQLDKKLEEYRELIAAITETYSLWIRCNTGGSGMGGISLTQVSASEVKTLQVIRDRILIASEVKENNILNRWIDATQQFDYRADKKYMKKEFEKICDCIVGLAVKASQKRDVLDKIFESIGNDLSSNSGLYDSDKK